MLRLSLLQYHRQGLHISVLAALCALQLVTGCAPMPGQQASTPLSVTEVHPGVFVHLGLQEDWAASNGGDVANSSFVVGSRCVAVIDTGGTPALGLALRETIARTTPLPVCYVINTHAHPDHMLGDVAFTDVLRNAPASKSPRPDFVASARYTATLSAREPYYLNALQRDFGLDTGQQTIVYPTIGVARTKDLDLGGRILTLQAWPTAHTDNDLTVLDQRTRTLFAGDLLFVQHLPALDGSLRGWLCAMDALRHLNVATVVPGHGAVSHDWPAALHAQTGYLQALLSDTRAAIRQGLSIQQAMDRISPLPDSRWLLTERFQRRNVTAAYAELEWEDNERPQPVGHAPCAARPGHG